MIKSVVSVIVGVVVAIFVDLWPALVRLLKFLFGRLRACFARGKKPPQKRPECVPIKHPSFMRPDPMIYDQYYLMSLGLAVTWQNPDIQLLLNGVPVLSPYDLKKSTRYTIRATIYNASATGVVYDMPVVFSYLSFGVGTQSHLIPGPIPKVSLGVRGSPQGSAIADMEWTTPATEGHYCIQVSFACADDANPFNNLGQTNTQVVEAASPAQFPFQLRNTGAERAAFHFEVDTFRILRPPPCSDNGRKAGTGRGATGAGESGSTRARNSRGQNPLPADWTIEFNPAHPVLAPGQEITVTGTITPPDSFHGTLPVNVHAFSGNALAGGVTLLVDRA